MRPMHETSTVEVRLSSGDFVQTQMACLDVGDVFRIRKPDGTLHHDGGYTVWVVTEMPSIPCEKLHGEPVE